MSTIAILMRNAIIIAKITDLLYGPACSQAIGLRTNATCIHCLFRLSAIWVSILQLKQPICFTVHAIICIWGCGHSSKYLWQQPGFLCCDPIYTVSTKKKKSLRKLLKSRAQSHHVVL